MREQYIFSARELRIQLNTRLLNHIYLLAMQNRSVRDPREKL